MPETLQEENPHLCILLRVNLTVVLIRSSLPSHCILLHNLSLGYGRRDVVEFLLSAGAQIQARDDGGLHPIHNACSFGHADVVRLLLEAGANPNVRDNWNFTPLHEAALKGKAEVCIGIKSIFLCS